MSRLLPVGEGPPNAFPVCLKQEVFSGVLFVPLVHLWASISGEVSWGGLDYRRGSQLTFSLLHQSADHC